MLNRYLRIYSLSLILLIVCAYSINARAPQIICPICSRGITVVTKIISNESIQSACSHYPNGNDIYYFTTYQESGICNNCGYRFQSDVLSKVKFIRCEGYR